MSTHTVTTTRTATAVQPKPPPPPPTRGTVHVVTLGLLVFLFWFLPDETLSSLEPKTDLGALAIELFEPPRLILSYLVLFFAWKTLGAMTSSLAWASANNSIAFFSFDPFASASSEAESITASVEDMGDALRVRGRPIANGIILTVGAIAFFGGFLIQLLAILALVSSAVFFAVVYLWNEIGLEDLFSLPIPIDQWIFLIAIILISFRLVLLICLILPRPSDEKVERLIAKRKARKLKRLEKPLRVLVETARAAEQKATDYKEREAAWADYKAFCDEHGVSMSKTFEIRWQDDEKS